MKGCGVPSAQVTSTSMCWWCCTKSKRLTHLNNRARLETALVEKRNFPWSLSRQFWDSSRDQVGSSTTVTRYSARENPTRNMQRPKSGSLEPLSRGDLTCLIPIGKRRKLRQQKSPKCSDHRKARFASERLRDSNTSERRASLSKSSYTIETPSKQVTQQCDVCVLATTPVLSCDTSITASITEIAVV